MIRMIFYRGKNRAANRDFFSFVLFFASLVFCCSLHSEDKTDKNPPVPNPLELSQDWWKYFDVSDSKLLQERIKIFENELRGLQKNLKKNVDQEVFSKIDQTLLVLDLVAQKSKELEPSRQPQLQLLQHYTLDQFLKIFIRLQNTKQKIDTHQRKTNALDARLSRMQSKLDRLILYYQTLSHASYDRLNTGVEIIELRAEYALQQLEFKRQKKYLNFLDKEKKLLGQELSNAEMRLLLKNGVSQEINQDLQKLEQSLAAAKEDLLQLEKQASLKISESGRKDFYIENYQTLAQSVVVENLNVEMIIDKMKLALVDMLKNRKESNSLDVQTQIDQWKKILDIAQEQHDFWLGEIKENQSHVSRMAAQALQKNKDQSKDRQSLVGNIHFELDKSLAELESLEKNIQISGFLLRRVQNQLVQKKNFFQTWSITLNNFWSDVADSFVYWAEYTLFRVKERPITLMILGKALLIVVLSFLVSHYLKMILIKRRIVVRKFSKSTEYVVLRLIHYSIIVIGFLIALTFIGLDFTNLAIVAGALGVGIGFGLQTIVSNISSGFMLLLKKYLKVGDIIELPNKELGTITAVNLQNTIIRTFDGAEVMIPNSRLTTQQLTNWTMKDKC